MFAGELLDAVLESGVLGGEGLDGLAWGYLVEVTDLARLADPPALGQEFPLGAAEFGPGVECAFAPGRLDLVVLLLGSAVVAAAAVGDGVLDERACVGVLVEARGSTAAAIAARRTRAVFQTRPK
ncbi:MULTISPECIES: hypothetical protein [unclassified Streptomyces]|uniref:hypothetical protein n=1 Tax=unclassified Streptomyces TaxID=2593676 RepID=UPI0036EF434B